MDKPLKGQLAYVTGAGRGLGRGAAVKLAQYGADVVLVARSGEELAVTAQAVEQHGQRALVLVVDVADPAALLASIQRAEKELGPISALVNNAAVLDVLPFEKTAPHLWERALAVNLHAPYHAMHYLYPRMVARGGGSIHNVSSGAGWKGFAHETAYCASKFGLEGLTKALALEASAHGVLVTLSTPGVLTKPTSVTMREVEQLPPETTGAWCDPLLMGEAFCYLAYARDQRLAGRRFDLFAVSQTVRQEGTLDLKVEDVLIHSRS